MAFAVVETSPSAQLAHARSVSAVPLAATRSPAMQSRQATHAVAFIVALYVPDAHATHVRSLVASPLVATWKPAEQLVHATHGLAALASSSHVPLPQSTAGAAPPGQ